MDVFEYAQLCEMTVKDLRALASERQIPGRSGATRKADLIELIQQHQDNLADLSGSDLPPNPPQVAPGAGHYPGTSNHVSQRQFFPPRNPPTLPHRFQVPPGRVVYTLEELHSKITHTLSRPPPYLGVTSLYP